MNYWIGWETSIKYCVNWKLSVFVYCNIEFLFDSALITLIFFNTDMLCNAVNIADKQKSQICYIYSQIYQHNWSGKPESVHVEFLK